MRELFTIIRTEDFIQRSSRLIETYPSLIDFNKFLNWSLQKDPKVFRQESGDYYSLSSSDLQSLDLLLAAKRVVKFPDVKVIYHVDIDKKTVTLMSISLVKKAEE